MFTVPNAPPIVCVASAIRAAAGRVKEDTNHFLLVNHRTGQWRLSANAADLGSYLITCAVFVSPNMTARAALAEARASASVAFEFAYLYGPNNSPAMQKALEESLGEDFGD